MQSRHTALRFGQPSWRLTSEGVEAFVSVQGGMMAPVRFTFGNGITVEPYYVCPWWNEDLTAIAPPLLQALRGDFFCLPFGAPNDRSGDVHEPHGAAANAAWTLHYRSEAVLEARLRYPGGGLITKRLEAVAAHPAIRTEHRVSGFTGCYPLGHHAILHGAAAGDDPAKPIWRLFTAPFDLGMTEPAYTEPTSDGEYYALAPGARFTSLEAVPTRWRDTPTTDCSQFPARPGFIDVLALYRLPAPTPAWTVAVNVRDRYAWYSLKDPRTLPATVLWMENRGRHGAPWGGRTSCIGVEETCSYFAAGLAAPDDGGMVGAAGIKTFHTFVPATEVVATTVQGVFPFENPQRTIVDFKNGGHNAAFVDDAGGLHSVAPWQSST